MAVGWTCATGGDACCLGFKRTCQLLCRALPTRCRGALVHAARCAAPARSPSPAMAPARPPGGHEACSGAGGRCGSSSMNVSLSSSAAHASHMAYSSSNDSGSLAVSSCVCADWRPGGLGARQGCSAAGFAAWGSAQSAGSHSPAAVCVAALLCACMCVCKCPGSQQGASAGRRQSDARSPAARGRPTCSSGDCIHKWYCGTCSRRYGTSTTRAPVMVVSLLTRIPCGRTRDAAREDARCAPHGATGARSLGDASSGCH